MTVAELLPAARWPEFLPSTPPGVWVPDPLGPGYEYQTLDFGSDAEGPLVATLVRYAPSGWFRKLGHRAKGVVLSVHGWSDYFYNRELAEFWHHRGYHFYALDLRHHGRSLRKEHELPGYISALEDLDLELDASLGILQREHPELPVVAQGHSMGGLILSLWISRTSPNIKGLVLNAPWLEFQGTAFLRVPINGLMEAMSRSNPRRKVLANQFDHYWQSLSDQASGQWDIHPIWRPTLAFPTTAGWLHTILKGHAQVARGLNLSLPILMLTSKTSHFSTSYSEQMQHTDSVIDVTQTRLRALKLGSFVTLSELDGAMHDVFTSAEPARATAFRDLNLWLKMLDC
ncbi:alpha/beta fold hydrolase [Glutamicibacter soli]|uniref:Alpha/beta fold hydrolase n=1 Tax=Glutamicibacter soli TaxID=453836 RepID=A0A6L9G3Z6_9MICC|nr:alpha/beta hydrolase [Glutamicibacter soli]NAZ15717.1 alpha/beta fold hydrolase [Glutamicibacter soli]